jgi:hypothetical protein
VLGRSAAEENGNSQLIFHEDLGTESEPQYVTRIDVMESWTSYDFLAWGACCSMTLTTLPG